MKIVGEEGQGGKRWGVGGGGVVQRGGKMEDRDDEREREWVEEKLKIGIKRYISYVREWARQEERGGERTRRGRRKGRGKKMKRRGRRGSPRRARILSGWQSTNSENIVVCDPGPLFHPFLITQANVRDSP